MSLFNIVKSGFTNFAVYVYDNLEETTAVLVSLSMIANIDIFSEIKNGIMVILFSIIKGIFTIITALISSYLVHELKKNQFNLLKMYRSIIKKLKRNEKNNK